MTMRSRRKGMFCAVTTALLGILVLNGCTASTAQKDAAMKTWGQCLRGAAAQLDDGTSDVTGVALAVKSMCSPELNTAIETYGQGMPLEAYYSFRDRAEQQALSTAAGVVMQERAARSRAHSESSPGFQAPR
jgi:hypothetical protein